MKYWSPLALALAAAGCGGGDSTPDGPPGVGVIVINEVMPSNTAACPDPFGEFDDWVELYNRGDADLDLGDFTLSDDAAVPAKARIPKGVVVPARGYKLLWLDGQVQGIDHFPFKLDAAGEQVGLYAPDGTAIDALSFGAAATDVSFARIPDGTGDFTTCATSTCGAPNGESCGGP